MATSSGAPPGPGTAAAGARRPRFSRNGKIGIGLLLTFVGLALLVLLFPTSPAGLTRDLPIAAAGIVALWVGGILMGNGSRS